MISAKNPPSRKNLLRSLGGSYPISSSSPAYTVAMKRRAAAVNNPHVSPRPGPYITPNVPLVPNPAFATFTRLYPVPSKVQLRHLPNPPTNFAHAEASTAAGLVTAGASPPSACTCTACCC